MAKKGRETLKRSNRGGRKSAHFENSTRAAAKVERIRSRITARANERFVASGAIIKDVYGKLNP